MDLFIIFAVTSRWPTIRLMKYKYVKELSQIQCPELLVSLRYWSHANGIIIHHKIFLTLEFHFKFYYFQIIMIYCDVCDQESRWIKIKLFDLLRF